MLTGKIGVTTARNATGSAAAAQARAWAEQLGALYVERPHNMGVDELMAQHDLAALVVGEKDGPRIHSAAGSFAYHPGMAVLRLQQLKRSATEHLLTALDLRPGKRVLDATLGLAADAAISSYAVGEDGTVVGLAEDYLTQCAPDSFDVVYFDPMFRHPVNGAKGMEALRPLSYEEALSAETLQLALRVAPRVVIKERSEYILREYGCEEFIGGKYSRIKYGIIKR